MEYLSAMIQAPLSRSVHAVRAEGGEVSPVARTIVEEVPIAFRYGGIAHAVMVATPDHLADFALGFSLTEGIIAHACEVVRLEARKQEEGLLLEIALSAQAIRRFLRERRVRQLRGHTSCGICGTEELADLRRPSRRVAPGSGADTAAIEQAVESLRRF
jgi:FdhD protein